MNVLIEADSAAHIRYQEKPFPGSSHTWAITQCEKLGPQTRVLDIGCGSGVIGQSLKDRGLRNLFAIEIDQEAKRHVAPIYLRVEESLEAYAGQQFDLILLLDVLEHLQDPFSFLKSASKLLSPGGVLLISVPNVAHWSARFQLLFGFFRYTERGILDKTHLQFFTRARLKQMVQSNPDLELEKLAASISPMEFVLPKPIWNNFLFRAFSQFRWTAAQAFPGLLGFQHLAVTRRRKGA